MDKQQIGVFMQLASIVFGVVTAIILIKTHPVPIILLSIEAGIYFVGDYLKK